MEKKIPFTIKEDIYDKFCLALNLSKEDEEQAVETCLKWYIAKTFSKVSKEYEPENEEKQSGKGNFYAKAVKRIPVWAKRPEQYSHKIIRGYFQCLELYGQVLLYQLEELCSQEEVAELYVPTFRNNYAQMKIDGAKTYGKVFEDDGKVVSIWSEVEETLLEYKDYFCE